MFKRMILIGAITFSVVACSHAPVYVHVPLEIDNPCIFEKFSEEEKDTMTEAVGRKIFRNQQACKVRAQLNQDKVTLHNEKHSGKD